MAVRLMRENHVNTNQSPNRMMNKHIELQETSDSVHQHKIYTIHEINIDEMDCDDLEPEIIEVDDITISPGNDDEIGDIEEEEEEEEKYDDDDDDDDDEDDDDEEDIDDDDVGEGEMEEIDVNEDEEEDESRNLPLVWDDISKIWEYYWKSDGINNIHIGFSCKEMYERNELYFKNSDEGIMFKTSYDSEWLSSAQCDLIGELIKYNDPNTHNTVNKTGDTKNANPFLYQQVTDRIDGRNKDGDDLEFACCTPMCAYCTMCAFLIIFIMELIISTEFEETVPKDGTAELGFWEFDGHFFHFLTILYAVLISITGAFIIAYCHQKLWLQWKLKPKYFCYMISGLVALWLLSAAIIDGAYEAEHDDAEIGFIAVFILIMIFTFCGPICLCCFVLSG